MNIINRSPFLLGTLLLVVLTSLQQFPDFMDYFFAIPNKFSEDTKQVYSLSVKHLPKGEYYLSLGRPRLFCDITYNNRTIFNGKTTIHDRRPSLLVGAGFFHPGGNIDIQADCRQYMSGFAPRLSFQPRIYKYTSGIAIHTLRNFIDMAAGPIACLFLVAAAFLNFFLIKNDDDKNRSYIFIAFSFIALSYSLSLAHYTRHFISGMQASQLHIILRTVFSIGMAALLHPRHYPGKILLTLHITVCILIAFPSVFGIEIESFYRHIFLLYPLTTYWTLYESRKNDCGTRDSYFLTALLFSWGTAQVMDLVKQFSGIGYFAAPLYMWAISAYLIYKVGRQQSRYIKASSLSTALEVFINSNSTLPDIVKRVASILHSQIYFESCTAYIHHSFAGEAGTSKNTFIRISSSTFSTAPERLNLDPVDTPHLLHAFDQGHMIEGVGTRDGMRFLILPIGKLSALCFSSTTKRMPRHLSSESKELLNLVSPSLSLLKEKLESATSVTNLSLNKLRSSYGDGTFHQQIGAIFIDIADYSKKAEEFGTPYTSFISSNFIPSLISSLKDYALPEVVRGDEVLFIICNDKPEENKNIPQALVSSLKKMTVFLAIEGQDICQQAGFGKIEFRVGFTIGSGALVIDDVQARTSGEHINCAKRLQDSALRGEFLTDVSTLELLNDGSVLTLSKKTIQVKKNTIEAVRVGIKRAA